MPADLVVDLQFLGPGVGIVGQGDERSRSVIHTVRCAEGEVSQVCPCRGEGGGEDDGVDILVR